MNEQPRPTANGDGTTSTENQPATTVEMQIRTDRPVIIEFDGDGVHGWCDNAYLFFTGQEDKVRENNKKYACNNGEELCG